MTPEQDRLMFRVLQAFEGYSEHPHDPCAKVLSRLVRLIEIESEARYDAAVKDVVGEVLSWRKKGYSPNAAGFVMGIRKWHEGKRQGEKA